MQQAAVGGEWLGLAAGGREAYLAGIQDPDDHVVDVVVPGVAAGERVGLGPLGCGPAARADQGGRALAHGVTPVRPLNWRIISSHASVLLRRPVQNDGSQRAANDSTGTPCCSTQVK